MSNQNARRSDFNCIQLRCTLLFFVTEITCLGSMPTEHGFRNFKIVSLAEVMLGRDLVCPSQ